MSKANKSSIKYFAYPNRLNKPHIVSSLIVLFFGTVYLLTGNQNFIFDALANALACEDIVPSKWFHSNHILYPFTGMLWYRLERLFGYTSFAVYSLERFNSILTAIGLGLFYQASLKFSSYKLALGLTFLLGSSYAVWHYAVDGYTMGAVPFFICLLLWHLSKLNDKKVSKKDILLTSVFSFLYIGIHAFGILHTLAIAWWFYQSDQNRKKTIFNNNGMQYFLWTTGFVLISYLGIYYFIIRPVDDVGFISWALGYAAFYGVDKALDWYYFNFNPIAVLKGHWVGWSDGLIFPFHHSIIEKLSSIAIGIGSLVLIGLSIKKHPALDKKPRLFFRMLVGWSFLSAFIIGFWGPGFPGFRIHFFFPLFLAALMTLKKSKKAVQYISISAALIFLFNFSGPIYYNSFIQNNKGFQLLTEINSHLKKGDLILTTRTDIPGIEGLRAYFFPQIVGGSIESRLFEFKEDSLDPLTKSISRKYENGKSIFFTKTLFEKNTQNRIEKEFGLDTGEISKFLNNFAITDRYLLSNGITISRVKLK